jgi:hypothetical protein
MTRRSIAAALSPLLVGLLISASAPAVGADPPCILDNAGNCAAQVAASDGQAEYDQIRIALEMASAASTAPIAASLSGPTGGSYEEMATSSMSN